MTGVLLLEVADGRGGWRPAAILRPGDPPGSISSNHAGGRDIFLFRCEPDRSVISRSTGGADFEAADGAIRAVAAAGLAEVAVLGPGESFDLTVLPDRSPVYTVRWTHKEAG